VGCVGQWRGSLTDHRRSFSSFSSFPDPDKDGTDGFFVAVFEREGGQGGVDGAASPSQ
jgi:16S rRNA C967 or C1407 C5-methylase (RsmB/RsmF family)